MSFSERGTVIFGTTRERFAVIAADRLYYTPESDSPTSEGEKIIVHGKLPIAVAIAGLRRLPVNVGPFVRDRVQSALDSIGDSADFTINYIKELLMRKIYDFARDSYISEIKKYNGGGHSNQAARCQFMIATIEDGVARIGTLIMSDTLEYRESLSGFDIIGPEAIAVLQEMHKHDGESYLGLDLHDAPSVAARVVAVIGDVIKIDHDMADRAGKPHTVGGPIDCFIVSEEGASRFDFSR